MDAQLEALRERWAQSTAIGLSGDDALGRELLAESQGVAIKNESAALYAERNRLRAECVEMAQAYVDANKAACEARFGHLSLEQLVADVSHYRANERVEDVWATDAWILANFEPQNIGGTGNITIRRPGR